MATQRVKPARGLINVGNTCYLNSVVQALNSFPLFHNYIRSLSDHGLSNGLLNKLKDTLTELKKEGATAFRPSLVTDESLRKHFKPGEQQDAHEFLTFLLDEIVSSGSGSSGSTPVEEARASGLASGLALLLADPKKKPRLGIATTRSHMDAALYSSPGHISLTQSTVLAPSVSVNMSVSKMPLTRNLRESLSAHGAHSLAKSETSVPSVSHSFGLAASSGGPLSESFGSAGGASMLPSGALESYSMMFQKSKKTLPSSPFMGKMESTIYCKVCGSAWSMIQPMTMLSAYIPPTPKPTLEDCIVGFRKSEDVRDVHCQRCNRTRRVEKRLSVAKAPEILCIFINRLKYEKIGNSLAPKKLDAHVEFGLSFDLATATSQLSLKTGIDIANDQVDSILAQNTDSGSAISAGYGRAASQSSTAASPSPRNHFSGRDTPSEASSVASTSEFRESRFQHLNQDVTSHSWDYSYHLLAIIVHIGNSTGGHYIMFKAPKKGDPLRNNWLQISDSDVREVPFAHVQRQHAYMLFYQKDTCPFLPSEDDDVEDFFDRPISPPNLSNSSNLGTSPPIQSPIPKSPMSPSPLLNPQAEMPKVQQNGFHGTENGFRDPEPSPLPNGQVHHPSPLGSTTPNASSSSISSSSLPTSSPEPEETQKSKLFLEPDDSPEPDLNGSLRSAQGVAMEMLQRPLQEFGDPHEGFNAILASSAES